MKDSKYTGGQYVKYECASLNVLWSLSTPTTGLLLNLSFAFGTSIKWTALFVEVKHTAEENWN